MGDVSWNELYWSEKNPEKPRKQIRSPTKNHKTNANPSSPSDKSIETDQVQLENFLEKVQIKIHLNVQNIELSSWDRGNVAFTFQWLQPVHLRLFNIRVNADFYLLYQRRWNLCEKMRLSIFYKLSYYQSNFWGLFGVDVSLCCLSASWQTYW